MEYTVQRPSTVWIETTVEADSLETAIELADEDFSNGDFTELDDTWEVDYDRYWAEDENGETEEGKVITETYYRTVGDVLDIVAKMRESEDYDDDTLEALENRLEKM